MSNVLVNETSLQNIANAIRTKNGSSDTYTPSEMSTAIENIPSGGNKFAFVGGGGFSFRGDTRNNLQGEIDNIVANVNTSTITQCYWMFQNCINITSLDLRGFDTSNVVDMNGMFRLCKSLTTLDLSTLTSTNVEDISYMFYSCINLMNIDMRNFNFTTATTYDYMFGNNNTSYVPANCLIIVKDATQKQWLNTNFSRMTNVKTVAEYEGS